MTSLVTLAHRVSGIYTRYSKIHSAVFAFSLSRLMPRRDESSPAACRHQSELVELQGELEKLHTLVAGDQILEPNTTLGREFASAMDEYLAALLNSVKQLATICGRRCQEKMGVERYGEKESRGDRVNYDQSVQIYQRCGERLSLLFRRL